MYYVSLFKRQNTRNTQYSKNKVLTVITSWGFDYIEQGLFFEVQVPPEDLSSFLYQLRTVTGRAGIAKNTSPHFSDAWS